MEVITLDKIKYLVKLKEAGKPLPIGWNSLILNYLDLKRKRIKFHERKIEELKKHMRDVEKWLELLMR